MHSPFFLNDKVEALLDFNLRQRAEAGSGRGQVSEWQTGSGRGNESECSPEASAPGLNSGNDLVDVVANDAEPHILGVLLDNCISATHEVSASFATKNGTVVLRSAYRGEEQTEQPVSSYRPRRG